MNRPEFRAIAETLKVVFRQAIFYIGYRTAKECITDVGEAGIIIDPSRLLLHAFWGDLRING